MDQTKDVINRSNPLRKNLRWEWIALQAAIAIGIGLYALLAEDSARRNIVFAIGAFLLVNGVGTALGGLKRAGTENTIVEYRLIGAGMSIATGAIVVLNRIWDFQSLKADRVVLGIGLLGVGLIVLIGIAVLRDTGNINLQTVGFPLLLVIWGVASIYQASNDASSSRIIGWVALIIGLLLVGLAFLRRQATATPAAA
jgi:uncharacterized membrane protein HdeD (DUF308 family)